MAELHLPWLELAILLPLVGAVLVARVRDPELAQQRTLIYSGIALLCVVGAWFDFAWLQKTQAHDHWSLSARLLGYEPFVIDELNAPLLPMAALVYFVTALATLRTKVRRFSFALTLISEAILLANLSCPHPWGIIALLGAGVLPPLWELRTRRKPLRIFVSHMALFVGMLVLGWALVVHTPAGQAPSIWAIALLTGAVLIRCGIVPMHCWITDLFEHASFGRALLFVTPMVGVYAAIRLLLPIAPQWALRSIALLSLFTAVYAAGMALVQNEARRFFCYLFLSHASLVLVGLEIATPLGLTGALCLWLAVCLSLTGFGLVLRSIESRTGRVSLSEFHGLYEHTPTLAAFFMLTGLASIGFPGTIGFVGSELLIDGTINAYRHVPYIGLIVGPAVVLAAALNGIAVLRAYFRVFTGKRYFPSISLQSRLPERIAVLTLAVLILAGGLFPQPSLTSRHHAAVEIIGAREKLTPPIEGERADQNRLWFEKAPLADAPDPEESPPETFMLPAHAR